MLGKAEDKRRKGRQRIRWLEGIIDSIGYEFEQTPGEREKLGSLVWCSSWGCKEWDMT